MTDRLMLYNEALRMCDERSLASLTEEREPRRLLDSVWNNGGVKACLEQGQWNFCGKLVRLDYDTAVTPTFGYNRAFSKPTDWVRTSGVCSDEFFTTPLIHFNELSGYWYASIDQIFVEYVSNDASYGNDLSVWPQAFADFVAGHFAWKIVKKLTGDEKKQGQIKDDLKGLLLNAKNLDASGTPTKFPAPGSWSRSRSATGANHRDRGNRGSLIG